MLRVDSPHGDEEESEHGSEEVPSFSGDSNTIGLNAVYKWSPNGNPKDKQFILQAEYFQRDENGSVLLQGSNPLETSTLDADQSGFYVQGIYKFASHWRAGIRYGELKSNNTVVIGSKIPASRINEKIFQYTRQFVLCPDCGKPDTQLMKEDGRLNLKCQACGAKHIVKTKIQ